MDNEKTPPLDLSAIRKRLEGKSGKRYWRSLEEVADTPQFQAFLEDEFPGRSTLLSLDRRDFLKVMGASLALAGLAGCRRLPKEEIVPYVTQPEEIVPNVPLRYASALSIAGFGFGVLVESHEGRPTKIEGNPNHPASLGSSDQFAQAEILNFYDPDRSRMVRKNGDPSTYEAFLAELRPVLTKQLASGGAGLRVLSEAVSSPTMAGLMEKMRAKFPAMRWHQWEPAHRDAALEGARLAFGEDVDTIYHFDRANVILSLDADVFTAIGTNVRYARDLMKGRRVEGPASTMNRLYAVECTMTLTGATADHRIGLRAEEIEAFARALASRLGVAGATGATPASVPAPWFDALTRDLMDNAGSAVVVAGHEQPAVIHALAHAMNASLGAVGTTVKYIEPIHAKPVNMTESLRDLTGAMGAGRVDTLIILGGNPVFSAPSDVPFAKGLASVKHTAHIAQYDNETSAMTTWHVNEAHPLEAWGDVRAYDGTASIVQPLSEPLFGGKSQIEVVAALLDTPDSGYNLVRAQWKAKVGTTGTGSDQAFEKWWRRALYDGVIPSTSAAKKAPTLVAGVPAVVARSAGSGGIEVVLRPDPGIFDGRFANNGWLQELPKPFSKLTWENAAYMSVSTAEKLGLTQEDYVEISHQERSVKAPVWLVPGLPDDSITLHLGFGRTRGGQVSDLSDGFDANALRTSASPWEVSGAKAVKAPGRARLATTQHHHAMEGRDIVRVGTLAGLASNPTLAPAPEGESSEEMTLYHDRPFDFKTGNQWGMSIDLGACTGCNACVVACQAENNIPVVGKEQVMRGRIMQWIRIDGYYGSNLDDAEVHFQPLTCMQCESAPCEPVCPVGATVHSHEGLNQMVYNRCVGTRYCSNNCPYKVRRFNFLNYTDNMEQFKQQERIPLLRMLNNPNVTVRGRGVMEKCTYCVQRINAARITAKKEGRDIKDGEIVTACQQACPTQAIVFGNINDPESAVVKRKANPRNYLLLEELNTRPRTTYLAKVKNPNPGIGAN
ncbi:MAG: TAT-variant-translocated molybdopterin oxidoreductase [Fimbriimonadaceae bacterium]|nr:TAT-variant-translocated molybdopterin oxidoreductase [Fimbriimonadaceae bacterium]